MSTELARKKLLKEVKNAIADTEVIEVQEPIINSYKLISKTLQTVDKAIVKTKVVDNRPIITYASENISNIMGYTPEELQGNSILDYRAEPINEKKLILMITELDNGKVIIKDNLIKTKEGKVVKVRGMLYKQLDEYVEFVWKEDCEINL